jgi:hypothetical protein
MGLVKGTLTVTKYRVTGTLPPDFNKFIDQRIKEFAFTGLATGEEEKSVGWTSLENILDTNFEYANYALAGYLIFSLRIDRKVVPPALLKLKVLEAERDLIAHRGTNKIYKEDRRDIKERVRFSLLHQTQPIPAFYEICWNVDQGWLIFGSLSEKIRDDFEDIFKRAFNVNLRQFVPWDKDYADADTFGPVLASYESKTPASSEHDFTAGTSEVDLSSIGREFLTWLWFKSEERGGTILIPETGDIELIFVQKLILESGEGQYSETVSCHGIHSDLNEGKAALRKGKKIREARLKLGVGTDECEFTLKADNFQFQSMKFPPAINMGEEDQDREGRILERIYLLETTIGTMEKLFALFLKKRRSPQWNSEEVQQMKRWMQE